MKTFAISIVFLCLLNFCFAATGSAVTTTKPAPPKKDKGKETTGDKVDKGDKGDKGGKDNGNKEQDRDKDGQITYADILPSYTEYGYSPLKNGPQTWGQRYSTCSGKRQSPVDMAETEEIVFGKLPNLQYEGMWDARSNGYVVQNAWNSVEVTYTGEPPRMRGGPLKTDHILSTITFHWGNEVGSEHAFDRYFYGMEMHLIFYKKQYENILVASKANDGIAIVAVFFKVSQEPNTGMMQLISVLKGIIAGGNTATLPDEAMNWMRQYLPEQRFFTYQGSLTAPPCSEIVTWIIMEEAATISQKQKLKGGDGQPIVENRRPLQSLNGRVVYYSTASTLHSKLSLALSFIVIIFTWR